MTTIYKFKAGYTKLGVATAPASAPTIKVVDSADNILVAALTATTALANLAGAYLYSYSGADGLDLIGLFHTSDATMDQQDLFSIPDMFSLMATAAALTTAQGNITTILADYARRTGDYSVYAGADTPGTTSILADYARRTGDYSVYAGADTPGTTSILADYARRTGDYATVAALWAALTSALTTPGSIGKLLVDNIDQPISSPPGSGSGSIAYTPDRVTDPSGNPVDGVDTWINTSATNSSVGIQARAYTNALGVVDAPFMLDPGTYYVWRQKGGSSFLNPQTVVVN